MNRLRPSAPKPQQEVPFGGHVTDGNFRFKVTSAKPVASIPVSYESPIKAKPCTKLIRVDLLVTNEGNVPSDDPFCGDSGAVLIDTAQRNFGWNSDQTIMVDGNGVCGNQLQPLLPSKFTLLFDVPAAAGKIVGIALWDSNDINDTSGDTFGVIDPTVAVSRFKATGAGTGWVLSRPDLPRAIIGGMSHFGYLLVIALAASLTARI